MIDDPRPHPRFPLTLANLFHVASPAYLVIAFSRSRDATRSPHRQARKIPRCHRDFQWKRSICGEIVSMHDDVCCHEYDCAISSIRLIAETAYAPREAAVRTGVPYDDENCMMSSQIPIAMITTRCRHADGALLPSVMDEIAQHHRRFRRGARTGRIPRRPQSDHVCQPAAIRDGSHQCMINERNGAPRAGDAASPSASRSAGQRSASLLCPAAIAATPRNTTSISAASAAEARTT